MPGYLSFDSQIALGVEIDKRWSDDEIKNEPMFFSCALPYAYDKGGEITKTVLDALPVEYRKREAILDTRVHMLQPGFFPAIPGWHHDDVPRTRKDGQPNYHTPEYKARHIMFITGSADCPTEFAIGKSEFPDVPLNSIYYRIWHPMVEYQCDQDLLQRVSVPGDRFIAFDWNSWHQGVPCRNSGWRWFFRVSIETTREIKNEIRRQVQVYMSNPMQGW